MEKKLRAYFVDGDWDRGTGFAVIAYSAKEAKKMMYGREGLDMNDWIELHVKWIRDAIVDGCHHGQTFESESEMLDAMYRGMYGSTEHMKCPNCGADDTYVQEIYDGVFGCSACEDDLTKEDVNNPYKKNKQS